MNVLHSFKMLDNTWPIHSMTAQKTEHFSEELKYLVCDKNQTTYFSGHTANSLSLYSLSYPSSQVFWVLFDTPCFIQILHASISSTFTTCQPCFLVTLQGCQDMMHIMWHTSNYRMIFAAPQWTCPPTQKFEVFRDVMPCCEESGKWLQWSRGSMLPLSTQVHGFKPGWSRQDFSGRKILSMPSFRKEVKPWVPCRRFVACKRSLNWHGSHSLRQNYQLVLAHIVPPFATRISRVGDMGALVSRHGNV